MFIKMASSSGSNATVKTMSCILSLVFIFSLSSLYLYVLSRWLPDPNYNERWSGENAANQTRGEGLPPQVYLSLNSQLSFPSSIDELKALAATLKQYKKDHIGYVGLLFCSAYLYKQTFAIPGSVFMNLLAGALFGIWIAFPLTCILTACGATCCYLLSKMFGKVLLLQYFPDKVAFLQDKVHKNLDRLFFFLLFLRLFPMSPNWFLNMASPVLDIPMLQFFCSVLIGLMPYNFLCCQTGCLLSQLTSMGDIFTTSTMLKLATIAIIAMLPALIMKRLDKKYSNNEMNKNE